MADETYKVPDNADILVLSLLKDADRYGYEIISELKKQNNPTFHLAEGMLNPVQHTLEQNHHVRSYIKNAPTGRSRRYYRLTKSGEKYLRKRISGGSK